MRESGKPAPSADMPVDPHNLVRIQQNKEYIRNICILAHVDHGKTSLSDCLLASNGIISPSQQGVIRYLDSRPDEQAKGITMESSAVALYFRSARSPASLKTSPEAPQFDEYLVNLIDSPGHIDFSSEVSTAARLCDGAVILVDAVEGVCSQTVTVLKQVYDERIRPLLVVNKIDRLVTELQMTPQEAGTHLTKLIEQVNAVLGSLYAGKRMEFHDQLYERKEKFAKDAEHSDLSEDDLYFTPQTENVIFTSAIDGWGFSLGQFAAIYSKRLSFNREKLQQILWGDYYLDMRTKKVSRTPKSKSEKTIFVQFVLDNIWAIYKAAMDGDTDKVSKIVNSLGLKIPDNCMPKVGKSLAARILSQWLPVSRSLLLGITLRLPSPVDAQRLRYELMLSSTPSPELVPKIVSDSIKNCDSEGPVVAYVSKVIRISEKDIAKASDLVSELRVLSDRLLRDQLHHDHGSDVLIGVARVYSGRISIGMELDLLNPRHVPGEKCGRDKVKITGLYVLMGRDFIPMQEALAGSIVGIGGLDGGIVKSGTLISPEADGPNFARGAEIAQPILYVALEPEDPTKLDALEEGLRLLNISDPSVEVTLSNQGEHILGTAGELHLERCLKDLTERFAKIEIQASQPIVPYRETIVGSKKNPCVISVGDVTLSVETQPLDEVTKKQLQDGKYNPDDSVVAINGTNILMADSAVHRNFLGTRVTGIWQRGVFDGSIISGFHAAMANGPLASEPVEGVLVRIMMLDASDESPSVGLLRRMIPTTRDLILKNMKEYSQRLLLATYLCEIQASTEVLGKVYPVVTRRHGRVLSEEHKEGTPFFTITASLPVINSFGFSEEIRKRTSGAANSQLIYHGFEILDEDPYWVPSTEEELEHIGKIADRENLALTYVNAIRRRKGLRVNEKVVESSEAQRNLKR